MKTKSEQRKAIRQLEKAIDALIELRALGCGDGPELGRILDNLNSMLHSLNN